MGWVLALCATVPALILAMLAARALASSDDSGAHLRLHAAGQARALELLSRLHEAGTIIESLPGSAGPALDRGAAATRALRLVAVVDSDGLLAEDGTTLRPSPAQLLALERGRTILLAAAPSGRPPLILMARAVDAHGRKAIAYFELAADWLWAGPHGVGADVAFAVVDRDARILHAGLDLPGEVGEMLAQRLASGEDGSSGSALGWQASGEEWHGVLVPVPLADEWTTGPRWGVVTFAHEPTPLSGIIAAWPLASMALLIGLACAGCGALHLARRHAAPLVALRAALAGLRVRRFDRLAIVGGDEPGQLVTVFNDCAAELQEQFRALETLGEIDRLLLGSAELEQVLGAILSRVQAVTRCHSVGITLRDPDSPGHGRVYLAAGGIDDLPVNRVALDDDMLATLAAESRGLTIARCENGRHSFLKPLKALGAEFFWVWPVKVAERLEAILAVGYGEAPLADPQIAAYGGEFADRLAIALSKTARDERLYRQAHYDPLTALPNRVLFRDRLARELAAAAAGASHGALLYIDLDDFKRVNDTVGHDAGDQLLTVVAQRLRSCVKDGDTVARLAGDEFTVILRNVAGREAVSAVAERIRESLQQPVSLAGREHFVCASIGITLFPDDGRSIDGLLRNADTAMYRAKDLGRSRTLFFDPQMASRPSAPMDTGLHRALRRREFSLYYQPQFSVADGGLAGIEALLRWQTPRDGMRHPGDFVPAAEESGLIVDIGGWVLEAACAQLASWRERGIAPPRLALNVSAQQLRHADFPKLVRRTLDRHGLAPQVLELELAEEAFADEAARAALARLAHIGVHLVLGDFGTGYSSLSYLRQFPISAVKIDRSFLEEVPQNPASATLVDTIIVMAHALDKRVVAEGVETLGQLDFLRERSCDVAQGFYLARPLAASAMTELLQARTLAAQGPEDMRAAG